MGGPSSNPSWQCYTYLYMLGTTTKLSMLFQALWIHLEVCFLSIGLTVTQISIKKVQKKVKLKKDVGIAHQSMQAMYRVM